ncbi:hypothetical protein [Pararhizobium antarcticum]|uniref:Uncharacterized protein n=1 Tax=Pararhizobium antarcticum TaxID=1798805 RepID=A0A657LTN0_9HYPH|nr:hypothetical protein [Pararhizobium antarcticum]OJF93887.1 hypothetical protein AX760_21070 [Pararhizobium antarcticum]OJF99280.1 hypothetical protein AX761_11180 [Rhizobium sp. 58]
MSKQSRIAATLFAASLVPVPVFASSDKAWDALRADVQAQCLAAVTETVESPKAVVDPFGSERFGLALVSGKAKGADRTVSYICVYDKQTKAAEIGSELTPDMLHGAP